MDWMPIHTMTPSIHRGGAVAAPDVVAQRNRMFPLGRRKGNPFSEGVFRPAGGRRTGRRRLLAHGCSPCDNYGIRHVHRVTALPERRIAVTQSGEKRNRRPGEQGGENRDQAVVGIPEKTGSRNGCWANQIECPQDARCPEQPTKRRFSVFERTDRPLEPFHFCPIVHLTRARPQPRRVLQASSCGRVFLRPSGTML